MASSLVEKMRVKENQRIGIVNAPVECKEALAPLPAGATLGESLGGPYDLIWYFARTKQELARDVEAVRDSVVPGGIIWLSYPKGGSGVDTDLKRDVMWQVAEPAGLQAVSQIAVDDVWSALRFKPTP
jgi:hypothetical protein